MSGLDKIIPFYDNRKTALKARPLRRHMLASYRAIVLCAGKGTRAAPLTNHLPKPMLDIFGKPLLHHIMDHLASFGLNNIILNPGHMAQQIHKYFNTGAEFGKNIFYVNEGTALRGHWQASPRGSASTLQRLQQDHTLLDQDTFVLCGDALSDIDLAEMMEQHKASGAVATMAACNVSVEDTEKYGIIIPDTEGQVAAFQEKPPAGTAQSTLANVGIYIFSASALAMLPQGENLDIACHLLPALLRSSAKINIYQSSFKWTDIGCGRDYYNAISGALINRETTLFPTANETRPGIWLSEGAQLSRHARLTGPVFLGQNCQILAGARIIGPTTLCSNSVIHKRAVVSKCLITAGTNINSGRILNGKIAAPDWTVTHKFADGTKSDGASPHKNTPRAIRQNHPHGLKLASA